MKTVWARPRGGGHAIDAIFPFAADPREAAAGRGCGSCPTESDASKKLPFLTFLRHRSVGPLGSMGEWAYGEPRQGVDAHRYGSGTPGENFLGSHLASAN